MLVENGGELTDNKSVRHYLYRNWSYINNGPGSRRTAIPLCITWKIRDLFPNPPEVEYVGYKAPKQGVWDRTPTKKEKKAAKKAYENESKQKAQEKRKRGLSNSNSTKKAKIKSWTTW